MGCRVVFLGGFGGGEKLFLPGNQNIKDIPRWAVRKGGIKNVSNGGGGWKRRNCKEEFHKVFFSITIYKAKKMYGMITDTYLFCKNGHNSVSFTRYYWHICAKVLWV